MTTRNRYVHTSDDAALFNDDFDIDEFLSAHDRSCKQRGRARRRYEEMRDRRRIREQTDDWEDWGDF